MLENPNSLISPGFLRSLTTLWLRCRAEPIIQSTRTSKVVHREHPMPLGKQAKIITDKQIRALLAELDSRRYPLRDRVMFLLSLKAGLRAHEIASVTWGMVTDAEGEISDAIALENRAAKGRSGRRIPMHPDLRTALMALHRSCAERARHDVPVIFSERDRGLSAGAVAVWFHRLYAGLGMVGCSSHSGRRTFITRAARKISEVGGSLRDVQQLAGHASLGTTSRYIEGDQEAQRKVVALI
jgi:integrase/recombinase XerC